jgi:hypothetical protein
LRAAALAGGALSATLLNPGFDIDLVMSNYADVATGVAVATCGLLGALALERAVTGRTREAMALAWRFAFVSVALVTLKQANPALLACLLGGFVLAAWRDPRAKVPAVARMVGAMLVPAALVWLSWRWYVVVNMPSGEMAFRSLPAWNFGAAPEMLASILAIHRENPLFYVGAHGIAVCGLAALRRPRSVPDRLLGMAAVCWIGYNAFLAMVYLGAMTADEAAAAAEYWRYSSHLGLLVTAALAMKVASADWPRSIRSTALAVSIGGLVSLPFVLVLMENRLSPLAKAWPIHYRTVGRALADMLPAGARVAVISGWPVDPMSLAVAYDLWRPGREDRDLRTAPWLGDTPDAIRRTFREGLATHLLLTGALASKEPITDPLGLSPIGRGTTLFAWDGERWHEQRSWPLVPVLGPEAVPAFDLRESYGLRSRQRAPEAPLPDPPPASGVEAWTPRG